jgi:hypothetical protein
MLTTYLAGFIEANPSGSKGWRDEVKEKLVSDKLLVYCPIAYESKKTGKATGENVKYVTGLKQGGYWDKVKEEMSKIWWGNIRPEKNRYEVIKQLQYKALIEGNQLRDLDFWGDFEAVARSSFIIVYYKKGVESWGTPAEALIAFFLNIPIYVISDVPKTEMNTSLLWWVLETEGEVFYKLNECTTYIKEKYKL